MVYLGRRVDGGGREERETLSIPDLQCSLGIGQIFQTIWLHGSHCSIMRGLRLSEEGLWCCSLQLSEPWFSYSSSDICHVTVVSSCIHCLVQLVIVTLGLWSVIPTVIRLDGSGLSIIMAECGCLSGGIASGPQPTSCCQYCSHRGQVNLLNACTRSFQWPLCYPIDLFKVTVWFWAISLILFC